MNSAEKKVELRKQFRRERAERFSPADSWIDVARCYEFSEVKNIASYVSYGTEPSTADINAELIRMGKTILLPRMREDHSLEWVIWNGNISSLVKTGNLMEPTGPAVSDSVIEAIIVPALHVDREGNRLGQGGGSYDRALASIKGWKIALVQVEEISAEKLPTDSHDQKIDAVATQDLIVRF